MQPKSLSNVATYISVLSSNAQAGLWTAQHSLAAGGWRMRQDPPAAAGPHSGSVALTAAPHFPPAAFLVLFEAD